LPYIPASFDGAWPMNKIVREHYPVSKLPEDLREGLGETGTVRGVIEEDKPGQTCDEGRARQRQSPEAFIERMERIRRSDRPNVTIEDAVLEIRQLRDEWDDE
jgi:hypothetical protein